MIRMEDNQNLVDFSFSLLHVACSDRVVNMMCTYMHFDRKINQSFILFIAIWFKIFMIHEFYNKVMDQPKVIS